MNYLREILKKQDKKNLNKLLIAFLAGILMLISSNTLFKKDKKEEPKIELFEKSEKVDQENISFEKKLEQRLEEALGLVDGVGKVKVLLTLTNGREIVIAENSVRSESTIREVDGAGGSRDVSDKKEEETQILINNAGKEEPLIVKEIEPKIEGVIIVAQGGGDIVVKDALIKAAQTVLGIEAHKVQILKMK